MDSAKQAVSGFLNRRGHEDTQVDESVRPAVTEETVKPTRHEETIQAIDREVHQHHYHTTVQPLQHQERLAEQHTSQVAPVQERVIHHGNEDEAKARFAAESGQFRNSQQVEATRQTESRSADQVGEHVHHHVHEAVQPVIHKTTHQPEVVHTTIPIHEKIHAPSEHHGLSVLPEKTLTDFNSSGGSLQGSGERQHHEEYEGHPRPYNPQLQQVRNPPDLEPEKHWGTHDPKSTGHQEGGLSSTGSGVGGNSSSSGPVHNSNLLNKLDPRVDSDRDDSKTVGGGAGSNQGYSGSNTNTSYGDTAQTSSYRDSGVGIGGSNTSGLANQADSRMGSDRDGSRLTGGTAAAGGYGGSSTSGPHDSNLANKADPRVDSDRDGSASYTGGGYNSGTTNTGVTSGQTGRDNSGNHLSSVQSPAQGQDPAVAGGEHTKLTGTGAPGSHSAVFGLTPDGHKDNNTDSMSSGPLRGAQSNRSVAEGQEQPSGDTGSRAATGGGIAQQLNDPRVGEKGHGGLQSYGKMDAGDKPGSGSTFTNTPQGSGTI